MLFLAQFTQELCEVVSDEAIIVGEVLRPELRDLPAGDIAVHTIQECRISTHFTRERIKQAGCFEQHIHTLIDIAYKDHTGRSRLFLFATSKGSGSHVVLHDLDAVFVFEVDASNLVKGHTIPQANEADCLAAHIVEQVCYRSLTAGYKDAVRRNFFMETDQDGMTHTTLKRVPGEGFVFGLYNGDPITYAGGTLEADTLLATAVSDKNGKISFSGQFPHGKYYVRELSGPEGWKLSETDILLIISDEFATENHEIVISLDGPVVNELIHNDVRVSKTDLTGTDYLPHTLIEVKSEDGKTVLKDYTGDDGYLPSFPAVPGKYTYPSETWP